MNADDSLNLYRCLDESFAIGRVAYKFRRDRADLVHELYLKCRRHADSIHHAREKESLIYRIGANSALSELRGKQREARRERAASEERLLRDPAMTPARELEKSEIVSAVRRALTRLPPAQREIIEACDLGYSSVVTFARTRNIPYDRAKSIRRRALAELAKNRHLQSLMS